MDSEPGVPPFRERERIEKLHSFSILDTPAEHEFDTLVSLVQRLLDVPMVLVSLVDDHRQWFKARCGIAAAETPRNESFCTRTIMTDDLLVVEDASLDPRFSALPFVRDDPKVRFYAGVPLRPSSPGFADDLPGIGTLCVLDTRPRTLSESERFTLRQLAGLVGSLITARASAATALRLSREARRHIELLEQQHVQLRQAERMAGIGSWRLDAADMRLHWSDQVFAIYRLPPGQAPPLDDGIAHFPEDRRAEIAGLVDRALTIGEAFDFESDFVNADGGKRRVRSIGEPQIVNGRVTAVIGVFQDVTDRHVREQSLRRTAETDALTGLSNRAGFEKRLTEGLARARAAGEPACLLLLDLDGFKAVNDTFGHPVGDGVLRVIADRLRRLSHGNAFVARLGGDEFVMLVTRPRDCARIEQLIATMLATLRYPVERDGEHRPVSATIGAAFFDRDVGDATDLIHRADLALYEAKRSQRGTGRIHGVDATIVAEASPVAAAPFVPQKLP